MKKKFFIHEAGSVAQVSRLRSERVGVSMKKKQSPSLSAFAGETPALP